MRKKIIIIVIIFIIFFSGLYLFSPLRFTAPGTSATYSDIQLNESELTTESALRRHITLFSETIGERNIFNKGSLEQTANYIATEFKKLDLNVSRQTYNVETTDVANIIGEKKGSDDNLGVIIIGGHYDSVSGSKGANDNASGIAAVIELARLLKDTPTKRTIRFVGFVNEEPPFFQTENMGSLVYARSLHKKDEKIAAMLSIETIGAYYNQTGSQYYPAPLNLFYPDTGNFIAFVSNSASKDLYLSSIRAFRDNINFPSEGLISPSQIPGVGWSDHWSFWQVDFPAIMITDTALYRYEHYHTDRDTIDKINFPAMTRVTLGMAKVIIELDSKL